MLKAKYFQQLVLLISLLAVSSFISANKEARDWTPLEVCEELITGFDKNAFAAFVGHPESAIEFKSRGKSYNQGCNIEVWTDYKPERKEVGGILLFRQSDSLSIYADVRRIYLKGIGRQIFTKENKSFFQTFPWFEEGFLEYRYKFIVLHAYTSKNDYIVFLFNSEFDPEAKKLGSKSTNKLMENKLSKRFVEFITIFTNQLYP